MHLDDLQYANKKTKKTIRTFVKEIRIFLVFFVVVVVVMIVFTNANLFASSFSNLFDSSIPKIHDVSTTDTYENSNIASIINQSDASSDEVKALLAKYQTGRQNIHDVSQSPDVFLRAKLKTYPFAFNTLPPVNEIIIPSLGLEVPIIVAQNQSATDFSQGNFDAELMSGVVKYPTTPDPGTKGNTLIF